jgi:hypothetical protein
MGGTDVEDNRKLEGVLENIDPGKRDFIKGLVVGVGFAIPTIASFSVTDLAMAQPGSPPTTSLPTTTTV